jgi:hypothetical protein
MDGAFPEQALGELRKKSVNPSHGPETLCPAHHQIDPGRGGLMGGV